MYKNLFCFWTGDNIMPKIRMQALKSLHKSQLNVQLITNDNLAEWILADYPLHEAFEYLSFIS